MRALGRVIQHQSRVSWSRRHGPKHNHSPVMLPPRFRDTTEACMSLIKVAPRFRGTAGARGAHPADFPCRRWKLHTARTGGTLLIPRLPILSVILLPGVTSIPRSMLIPLRNGDNIVDFAISVSSADCEEEAFEAIRDEAVVLSGENSSPSEGGDRLQSSCLRLDACRGLSCQASCGRGAWLEEAKAEKPARPFCIVSTPRKLPQPCPQPSGQGVRMFSQKPA